jgi:hypothetical protein
MLVDVLIMVSILLLGSGVGILSIWFYFLYKLFIEKDNETFTKID